LYTTPESMASDTWQSAIFQGFPIQIHMNFGISPRSHSFCKDAIHCSIRSIIKLLRLK
jgi:hypothetical protein